MVGWTVKTMSERQISNPSHRSASAYRETINDGHIRSCEIRRRPTEDQTYIVGARLIAEAGKTGPVRWSVAGSLRLGESHGIGPGTLGVASIRPRTCYRVQKIIRNIVEIRMKSLYYDLKRV